MSLLKELHQLLESRWLDSLTLARAVSARTAIVRGEPWRVEQHRIVMLDVARVEQNLNHLLIRWLALDCLSESHALIVMSFHALPFFIAKKISGFKLADLTRIQFHDHPWWYL